MCRLLVMRKTHALIEAALVLLADPTARHWGYELAKKTGIQSGVLYPLLGRLLEAGWLVDGWEEPRTLLEQRPPRRYYTLTEKGERELWKIITEARADSRFKDRIARKGV